MNRTIVAATLLAALAAGAALAQEKKKDRETKVRDDKARFEADAKWIYDDLPRGVEEAKKTGKPLLVVFRCIPCEQCAQIDEDVVARDERIAKLLDQFVCVRIPKTNGMDLSIFQFDYDQSWAAFFLEPDMTILGRYGTRSSQKDSKDDVSFEGFAEALQQASNFHDTLALRTDRLFARNRGAPLEVNAPESFPSFGGKFGSSLDYSQDKKVVPTCIHCHQLGDAQRRFYRDAGKPVPDKLLFPYPNPRVLGLVMDPKNSTRLQSVTPGSSAESDGFRANDVIEGIGGVRDLDVGQPVLSVADIQWALHSAGERESISVLVSRPVRTDARAKWGGAKTFPLTLSLPRGWRSKGDISWRASSWDLRRMTTGGMLLEALPAEERAKLGIKDGAMALVAKHVGQYGEHAAAKNAGFQKGDVVVSVNGRTDVMTETAWLTWLVNAKKPGEKIPVVVLRDGKKLELTLPIQ
jgi:hypothetical protein